MQRTSVLSSVVAYVRSADIQLLMDRIATGTASTSGNGESGYAKYIEI